MISDLTQSYIILSSYFFEQSTCEYKNVYLSMKSVLYGTYTPVACKVFYILKPALFSGIRNAAAFSFRVIKQKYVSELNSATFVTDTEHRSSQKSVEWFWRWDVQIET